MKLLCVWTLPVLSFVLLRGQSAPIIQEFGGLTGAPESIAAGPDGALWFTEYSGKIGRITTAGAVSEFSVPRESGPLTCCITAGPDGALWFSIVNAQVGRITTAGVASEFPVPPIVQPAGITTGPDGALWFAGYLGDRIGRITTAGSVTEFPIAPNSQAETITAGPDGALWFTELAANAIGRITTTGVGTQFPIPTALSGANTITVGPDGGLWFTEIRGNKIGRITTAGVTSEFAIPTANSQPVGIVAGPDGALWFTETNGNNIGRITTAGLISEFPIPTTSSAPGPIAAGPDGALWFVETGANKIGRLVLAVSPLPNTNNYTITTVAGNGSSSSSGDGGPATSAGINIARGVAVGQGGSLYVTDAGVVRKVDAASQIISRVAGGGQLTLTPLSHAPALNVGLTNNWGLAADNSGSYYIAETGGHNIDWVDSTGILHVLTNQVSSPGGLATDGAGNVYVADSDHCRIVTVPNATTTGNVTVVAGNGTCGYSGDGAPATSAQLLFPAGVAVDAAGNIYIADTDNSRIRMVSGGIITTVAGTGINGTSGDGGPAVSAQVNGPTGVAVDSVGNLYIADYGNARVRKVDTSGTIHTIAGGGSSLGDGGPATSAQLSFPYGLAVDSAGDVFIGDAGDYRIRKLTPFTITSLTPNSASAGGPALTLTVNGSGFGSGAAVLFDNLNIVTTFLSATQLTASIPANLIATTHTATVQVLNPKGGSSNSVNFSVTAPIGNGPTIITASSLPGGIIGTQYSQALSATGGTTPYKSWTVVSGSLPPGISLTPLGGVLGALLTGTPTASGTSTFTVQVTDTAGATGSQQFSLTISGGSAAGPQISSQGIVNAASYAGSAVAPGEIVTMFGSGLGPSSLVSFQLDANGNVPTTLAGTKVTFGGVAAPIIYTSATQISVVVPYEVAGQASTQVQVLSQNQSSNIVTERVVAVLPGIFTSDSSGNGQGAIVNQDGTINSSTNPAPAGSIVFVYATGEGQTNPAGVNGEPDSSPAPTPVAQPGMTATIGGMNAQVLYAGGVPGLVAGVLQVNVQIPAGVAAGSLPIQLSLGGQNTQTAVTIAIK